MWYSKEGTERGHSPPKPLLAVPNVTVHPSAASVPITVLMTVTCSAVYLPIKGLSCSHAVFSTRNIFDSFIMGGNTANLCSIDLSKAVGKVNHHGLYLKLMKRRIPVELLVFENWFSGCSACVKWNEAWSGTFYCKLRCKTRFSLFTILVQYLFG